jgi:hypothetical protein
LGATTITPGRFNVWGTVFAVYLLGAGVTGLQQMGVSSFIQDVFNGTALIVAVAISGYVVRRRAARRRVLGAPDGPTSHEGQVPVEAVGQARQGDTE